MTSTLKAAASRLSLALGLAFLVPSLRTACGGSLDDYLKREDPSFAWTVSRTEPSDAGTVYHLKLTSQTWQGIPWVHRLRVYEPAEVTHKDAVLLFITGGDTDTRPNAEDAAFGFGLARLAGARVALLPQVPNQPLLGGKVEDALIAETFVRYLDTKDDSWPLLFPMVKSAVKAMDAVQAWAKSRGVGVPSKFVVTGASKRGWTTWLTAASDPRVLAVAPMVIDTLNMKAQRDHSVEVWGKTSEEIDDYTRRGLTQNYDEPDRKALRAMVDPYFYLDRLTMPKFLINGTNDRYWTLDALNLYWNDLKGPKSVVYLPNAGHDLAVNRDYALNGLGAFFRANATARPWPAPTWVHADGPGGALTLTVKSPKPPKSARLWVARSDTSDFRDADWESTAAKFEGGAVAFSTPRPDKGFVALLGDLEYAIDDVPFHLSTQVRVAPAVAKK